MQISHTIRRLSGSLLFWKLLGTASLAIVLFFSALVVANFIQVRVVWTKDNDSLVTAQQPKSEQKPIVKTPQVKQNEQAPAIHGPYVIQPEAMDLKDYWNLLCEDGLLLKYQGGFIDCWIEIETEAKKEILGKVSPVPWIKAFEFDPPMTSEEVEGYIFLIHRSEKEAHSYDLIVSFQAQ
jgi:hypothetical protein